MIQVKAEGGDHKPPCKLVGADGNVFAVIGNVQWCSVKLDQS